MAKKVRATRKQLRAAFGLWEKDARIEAWPANKKSSVRDHAKNSASALLHYLRRVKT